jgi:hypothetical protein
MRLADHVTLSFNNNISTDAVFMDIEDRKVIGEPWFPGLTLKKLLNLDLI